MAKKKAQSCPHCGRLMEGAEADPALHATVERIVRAGYHYGPFPGQPGGSRVLVEARDAGHPSVVEATMSLDEAEVARVVAETVAKARATEPGSVAKMVREGLESARASVRAGIERGRDHADWQSRATAKLAQESG